MNEYIDKRSLGVFPTVVLDYLLRMDVLTDFYLHSLRQTMMEFSQSILGVKKLITGSASERLRLIQPTKEAYTRSYSDFIDALQKQAKRTVRKNA